MMRIKRLKMQDKLSIRKAVEHVMQYKIGKWWTPLLMQAAMWKLGAKVTEGEVHCIMEDLFEEAKDSPLTTYERSHTYLCYKCTAYFSPNTT